MSPPASGTLIELEADGKRFRCYLVEPPAGAAARGGVLLLHEWWGLNDTIKEIAGRVAGAGYVACAADLYDGRVTADAKVAGRFMAELDEKAATARMGAAIYALRARGLKVATLGWCMGGTNSLLASLAFPEKVAATVIYYGMPVSDPKRLARLKGPVLGIYARRDAWITAQLAQEFDGALAKAGVPHEFHHYDAEHAFFNPTRDSHVPALAADAWRKTLAFLERTLR